jgi:O-antigen/teichoic acid export membrane protein
MNTIQRIVKNTSILFISQILSYVLGFIYYVYAARYLGVASFGILSFALAFSGICGIFMDLGLSTLTIRDVARDKSLASRYIANVAIIKIILVLITFSSIVLVVNLAGYPQITINVVYIITLSTILNTFSQIFVSIFQANEKMEYPATGTVLNGILMLMGVIFAIYNEWNLIAFSLIYLFASSVNFVYYFIICKIKLVSPNIKNIDGSFFKPKLKEALPFGLTSIFSTIYVWIDSVMLFFIQGNQAVGLYSVAYQFIMVLLFIPLVISSALFPVMSKLFLSYQNSLKFIVNKYLKLMLLIGIPMGVGTTLLAPEIIFFTFGQDYSGSVIALQILIWATVLTFATTAYVKLFESTNKQATLTKITLIGALLNVILNLLLIPIYSYIAASINTVITEFMILSIIVILVQKAGYLNQRKIIITNLIKIIIASLIMGIFIWLFKGLNLLILIPISVFLYLLMVYVLKVIKSEDVEIIKKIRG